MGLSGVPGDRDDCGGGMSDTTALLALLDEWIEDYTANRYPDVRELESVREAIAALAPPAQYVRGYCVGCGRSVDDVLHNGHDDKCAGDRAAAAPAPQTDHATARAKVQEWLREDAAAPAPEVDVTKMTKLADALNARVRFEDQDPDDQFYPARCDEGKHYWHENADAEGDTCNCGSWYRFADRIERTPR